LPCIPDLPCNDGWDYDDIGAVGASTDSQEGTGLKIATAQKPDGYQFDFYNSFKLENGDTQYNRCGSTGFCFKARAHENNLGVRERFKHVFRDNGDGTLAFGIESADGHFDWVEAQGAFPSGPVRAPVPKMETGLALWIMFPHHKVVLPGIGIRSLFPQTVLFRQSSISADIVPRES